jgi:hypothetical protein
MLLIIHMLNNNKKEIRIKIKIKIKKINNSKIYKNNSNSNEINNK